MRMTYSEQLYIIKNIPLMDGERKVITCPFCYVPKKLSISKIDGTIMWNCFRASCNGKGIYTKERNINYVKNKLTDKKLEAKPVGRILPEITTAVENCPEAIEYLESVNSLEAYQNKLIKIRYAPSEKRVLFYSGAGAVGRLLSGLGAKWITYGVIDSGIAVGTGNTVVMVEDVPSACSVSRITNHVGLALLGTKISQNIAKTLTKYNNSYLILDRDANLAALKESKRQGQNIHVRFSKRDLKMLTTDQIMKVIN